MMKKIKSWMMGGIIGLVLGIILFLSITWDQFVNNIGEIWVWRGFILIILEPTLAGALIPLIYNKIMKVNINKIILWIIYLIIIGLIIWFTITWFIALYLGYGIVGL